ncbi:MAG: Ig-like domain-containing protein [Deltaproteobacteria bacterium]|nr:Ig-like domain-containing protein [Deltaproteobacteria bacterium]
MRAIFALLLPLAFLVGACPPPPDDDDTPPRVLSVEPATPVVPVTVSFTVRFSEALDADTVSGDVTADNLSVAIAPRSEIDDAFLSDLRNPPFSDSRQDDVVPVEVSVQGDFVTVTHTQPLLPLAAYTLAISENVRDEAANPLIGPDGLAAPFLYDFSTDAGAPEVASTDVPSNGIVPPNRKFFRVTFNQPVQNVSVDTLTLGGATTPAVAAVLMNEARTEATLVLDDAASGCERLAPQGQYTLSASSAIVADTGQALVAYSLPVTASAACDTAANTLRNVEAVAGEVAATVRFVTSKASSTEVYFGVAGGALDCLAASCPASGVAAGGSGGSFNHTAQLAGLTVDVAYDYLVVAEDEVGSVARAHGTFTTAPLPKITINEFLADSPDGVSDPDAEFIELTSFEPSATVDVSGWVVEETTAAGSVKSCTLPAASSIAPGGFLVMVPSSFDETPFGDVPDNVRATLSSWCGLNNEDITLSLKDASGRPIAGISTPSEPGNGRSLERTAPDAADDPASFCTSRSDVGPTPGRENGVVSRGCE